MKAIWLVALLVYTFGAFAYGAILVLWGRELGRMGWGGRDKPRGISSHEVDLLNGALLVVSSLWFVVNGALLLTRLTGRPSAWQLDVAAIVLAFCFPPLIMHVTWAEVTCDGAASLSPRWRRALWPAYAVSVALPAWSFAVHVGSADTRTVHLANQLLGGGLSAAFIVAAAYCIALVSRRREPAAGRRRDSRRSLLFLFAVMIALFVMLFAITFVFNGNARPMEAAGALIEVAAKSLPLVFMFVGTYYENRFKFFDLFVKRGLALLMTIAALTVWFALALPILTPLAGTWAGPWIFAIALVPVVGAIPWLYGRVSVVLDRRWLGRRFSAVEAVTMFLSGLRSATTEAHLARQAEEGLSAIFGAPATVRLDDTKEIAFETIQETVIPVNGGSGRFVMGPRASDAPYFSEDVALLSSLADVFASVLENLRLQERKRDQERQTRELSLHASRSELKALRAQINPHFLFNALNSIAGLIHREPAVADRTIEQLADVFRYALRGAESEWAILDDELDFVRAYLEVERARFGERLNTQVRSDEGARGARVPTMIVQTLVENAVKHGVAAVRGRASVVVTARAASGQLVVSVTDNGPGFDRENVSAGARAQGGYGLVNIRQRLLGYFGSSAALLLSRARGAWVPLNRFVTPQRR